MKPNGQGRSGQGFNRYMVECESIYHMSIFSDDKVLIDTWWNVNLIHLRFKICPASFNRYMVECEFYLFNYVFFFN